MAQNFNGRIKNTKMIKKILIIICSAAIIGYAYFYLNYIVPHPSLSTMMENKYQPTKKIAFTGTIIHNPIRDAYHRGIETFCWDNQLATHLLELDVMVENPTNPPTYLEEAWTLFGIDEIKNKNILPVFIIKHNFSGSTTFLMGK